MSTRSAIARVNGDGFVGVYHHWDGNPTGLGKTLWDLALENDLAVLLETLIDLHPAGWSTINGADWSKEPGFIEAASVQGVKPPQCYCHGDRSDEANPVTQDYDMGMEWAYVFDEDAATMAVLERVRVSGVGDDVPAETHAMGAFGTLGTHPDTKERDDAWRVRGTFPLNGPEPDWEGFS